jgi:Domain of unknown function (DUF4440)
MHDLEALERAGWDALSGPDGADFYEEHMAEDGLMLFPGMVMDKAAALDTIREVAPWSTYELEDVRVIAIGVGAGVVTYRASAERESGPYSAVMSSVYARREGSWLLVLHQQSPAA